ncbi:MAG: hypothetical protein KDC98_03820 [Planctomycetes bacterium]|nr:hypothetical protein [Planctomycetota bacterium]
MKHWKFLLAIPVVTALAMVPQAPQGQGSGDPALADLSQILVISELQYTTAHGKTAAVSAQSVVEIRLLEDVTEGIRLELYYDNGDYSMVNAEAFHLLRTGPSTREVKLVRTKQARMRFPNGIR